MPTVAPVGATFHRMTDRTVERFEQHDTDHGPGYANRTSSPTSGTPHRAIPRFRGFLESVARAEPRMTDTISLVCLWTHRAVRLDPYKRVQVAGGPAVLRGSLRGGFWVLWPEPGGVELDTRGRVSVPVGVLAVLGLVSADTVMVSRSDAGVLVLWSAACLDDVVAGVTDDGS